MQIHMQCLDYANHMIQSKRFKAINNQRVRTLIVNGEALASDRKSMPDVTTALAYGGGQAVGNTTKLVPADAPSAKAVRSTVEVAPKHRAILRKSR